MIATLLSSEVKQKSLLHRFGEYSIYAGLFFLVLSTSILNKCLILAVVFTLFGNKWSYNWRSMLKDKIIITALLLVLLFSIGTIYSVASLPYAFRGWDKYLKIFYFIVLLPLFFDSKTRRYAVLSFIFGVVVSEVFVYLHYFNILTFGVPDFRHWLFVPDIDASFILAFAIYILANLMVDDKKFRFFYAILLLFFCIDLLFLNRERTGYVVFLSLSGLFLLQRWGWKGLLTAVLVVPLAVGGLYTFSTKFNTGINRIFSNIEEYQKGHETTSIGLRFSFAKYSFSVIKNHPLLGVGTGSFEELYQSSNGPTFDDHTWPGHPHNEYLLILFQIGVVGLLVFLYWLYLQVKVTTELTSPEKYYLQGNILAFVVLSFCNASLYLNPAGICYVIFLAICLGSNNFLLEGEVIQKRKSICE